MKKISAANGQYTAKDGTQKTSWKNVGMIGVSANGKEYVLLDPTVNLAGFPREPGKDMLICSVFEEQQNNQPQQGYQQAPQPQGYPQATPQNNMDDPNRHNINPANRPPVGQDPYYSQKQTVYDANGNPIPV